jgi:hypothetical protein
VISSPTSPKDNSPLTWAARILSLLFHPIWLPLIYVTWKNWEEPSLGTLILVTSMCLIVFPGMVSLLWMWIRTETDWFVMSKGNRTVPLTAGLIGAAFFAVANGGLLPASVFQGELMAILILLLFISILVTLFWKISIHMLGWGAVNTFCLIQTLQTGNWLFLALILALTVLIAWARMRVKSHDWLQIVVGWGSGVAAAGVIVVSFP